MGSAEVKGVGEELGGFLREICVCVSTAGVPRPKKKKSSLCLDGTLAGKQWTLSTYLGCLRIF